MEEQEEDFLKNFTTTASTIAQRISQSEIKMCLMYFIFQGLIIPNFDDIHYMFLTDKLGISAYMYDWLNCTTYVGTLMMTAFYNVYLSKTYDVKELIQYQLYLILGVTLLQAMNASGYHKKFLPDGEILGNNKADVYLNFVCFLLGS